MQVMYAILRGRQCQLELPDATAIVLPGIRWGAFDELFTPAYWRGQAWQHAALGTYTNFRLGNTLAEELAACLLGGYGMPAELALAAYSRIREFGLIDILPSAEDFEKILSEPFSIRGGKRRYRFIRQKAKYLSLCLKMLASYSGPYDDVVLRDRLTELPGIGMKTASWIVRNHRSSNSVAILDVHVLRAGRRLGLFPSKWTVEQNYRALERRFLLFSRAIKVPTTLLDNVIWDYMRTMSPKMRQLA